MVVHSHVWFDWTCSCHEDHLQQLLLEELEVPEEPVEMFRNLEDGNHNLLTDSGHGLVLFQKSWYLAKKHCLVYE